MRHFLNKNRLIETPRDFFNMCEALKPAIEKSEKKYTYIPKTDRVSISHKSIEDTLNYVDTSFKNFDSVNLKYLEEEYEKSMDARIKELHRVPKDYAAAYEILEPVIRNARKDYSQLSKDEFEFICKKSIYNIINTIKENGYKYVSTKYLEGEFLSGIPVNAKKIYVPTPRSINSTTNALNDAIQYTKTRCSAILPDADFDFMCYKAIAYVANMIEEKYTQFNQVSVELLETTYYQAFTEYLRIFKNNGNLYPLIKNDTMKHYKFDTDINKTFDSGIDTVPLTQAEEIYLFKKYNKGKGDYRARQILIEKNQKLVEKVLDYYKNRGLPKEDLISEGNRGLIEAVDKFDVDKNVRFITYAQYWIKQAIIRGIEDTSRNIRIPNTKFRELVSYTNDFNKLMMNIGHVPNAKEMADHVKISLDESKSFLSLMNDTISLNTKISGNINDTDGISELGDTIPDLDVNIEEDVINSLLSYEIVNLLNKTKLSDMERDVVLSRYGFKGNNIFTLSEIANKYHVTREYIRQKEIKALNKLRRNIYASNLVDYANNPEEAERTLQKLREQSYRQKSIDTVKRHAKLEEANKKSVWYTYLMDAIAKINYSDLVKNLDEGEEKIINYIVRNNSDIKETSDVFGYNEDIIINVVCDTINIADDLLKQKSHKQDSETKIFKF